MRLKLFLVFLIVSIGITGCSSHNERTTPSAQVGHPQPQETYQSQETYPQLEETLVTGPRTDNKNPNNEKRTITSRAEPKAFIYTPTGIVVSTVLCTLELILLSECDLPY